MRLVERRFLKFTVNSAVKLEKDKLNVGGGSPKHGCVVEFEGFGTKAYVTILGEKNDEQ